MSMIVRQRMRRRYMYSYTKKCVMFVLSVALSIVFSPFFERYGGVIFRKTMYVLFAVEPENSTPPSGP